MTETTSKSEPGRIWKEYISRQLIAERRRFLLLAVLFLGIAVGLAYAGQEAWSIITAAVSAICWLQYFDTNGQLREVRRRSDKVLVPDFSVLNEPIANSQQQRPAAP